jgi:hypothetical protein
MRGIKDEMAGLNTPGSADGPKSAQDEVIEAIKQLPAALRALLDVQ